MAEPATGDEGIPARALGRALLRWYDRERRDLPWRRAPDHYRTLVSETMLQQTTVAAVVPYFLRFVERFPDFATLASAREDEVLAAWSGLGYYARGRNLHRAARVVVERHGGTLPSDEAALRALPGVGPYTAAAVAAIAFGVRTFALDGNAARVMARLFAAARPIDEPAWRTVLRARGLALVPADRPGDFAQAVMELGARVCGRTPACGTCPIARFCRARAAGTAALLPVRSPRRPRRAVVLACAAALRRGRVLLERRPAGTLLGGTWALPAVELGPAERVRTACGRALAAIGLALTGRVIRAGAIRHVFTHRDVTAHVALAQARGRPRAAGRWVAHKDLGALALSSFARKTLALLAHADRRA